MSTTAGNVFYVSNDGSDNNKGTATQPFKTVQRAADVMYPGDKCVIRAGVYREWVKPLRGGNSDMQRITYMAAEGEEVVIKGSQQVTGPSFSSYVRQ